MIPLGWPLLLGLAPVAGLALELSLIRARWTPYLRVGVPLHLELVPVARPPEGEGQTSSVCWRAGDDGLVRWWANARGDGLVGLHGVVRCFRARRGVGLAVRWAPPWSPLVCAAALALYGTARGFPQVALPIAAAMIFGLLFTYRHAAVRAAAELRWSFIRDGGAGDDVG